MEPYTRNGGMIGRTLDFEDEERYITGTTTANVEFIGANSSVASTSLTLPTGLEEGDLVLLVATSDAEDPPYRPSGYTNIYDERPGSTGALACYKFMGASPDTFISGLNDNDRTPYIAMVFRGVDTTTPLDVAYTQSSTAASGMPNPPSITTVSDGCMIVAVGHLDDDDITATAPSGYTLAATKNTGAEAGATVMAAYLLQTTAGAEDPGVFGGGGSDENEARTLALRPATTTIYGNKKNSGIWDLETVYENNAPPPPGQEAFTTTGTSSWTAPENVTSVCVVCVGGGGGGSSDTEAGGGGAGGGLGWKNNISVVPGNSYTVVVGAGGNPGSNGGDSYFINTSTVAGYGGEHGLYEERSTGGGYVGDGGGNGGDGGTVFSGESLCGGGGGAGGYSGNGGQGGNAVFPGTGSSGSGGGGGGGGAGGVSDSAGGGGGVGILGEGSNGAGGSYTGGNGDGGGGGSGGTDGTNGDSPRGDGGVYGGGGGGADNSNNEQGIGGNGAVRIIWGGGRAFPSTETGDL